MKISIEIIEHSEQRYDTPGDWVWTTDHLAIRVSDTGIPRYNFLLALHEFVEAMLCNFEGITDKDVDRFDLSSEWKERGFSEPGEDPQAPYYLQHQFAELLERITALEIGVDWREYGKVVEGLHWEPKAAERTPLWGRPWYWIMRMRKGAAARP